MIIEYGVKGSIIGKIIEAKPAFLNLTLLLSCHMTMIPSELDIH